MNWLEEVREVLRGMNVDAVEMSDQVKVRFGGLNLLLNNQRCVHWYALSSDFGNIIPRAVRSQIELIEDNLAARGWRVL
jgi:hypothetical protein